MGEIQTKLNNLQPYINGIRFVEGVEIVEASFKTGWVLPTNDMIQMKMVDEATNHYMFYSDNTSIDFDGLLNHVEGLINLNIEREKKYELLKLKIADLQNIFNTNPLSKLNNLKISFEEIKDEGIMPSLTDMNVDWDKPEAPEAVVVEQPQPISIGDEYISPEDSMVEDDITEVVHNGQTIELPPKPIPEKIVVEDYNLPQEMTEGYCDCVLPKVCPKCMDDI